MDTDRFDDLIAWIDEHIGSPITLVELAKHSQVSVRQLVRVFKARTGRTPYKYILHRRIENAKDLISSGEHDLVDVAALAGFANQAHMADTFRKMIGIRPSSFTNRKNAAPITTKKQVRER